MKTTNTFHTRGSTLFLRLALLGLAALVGCLSALLLWSVNQNWNPEFPELSWLRIPILIGLFGAAAAFFVAVHQAWLLLIYLDKKKPFSSESVTALKYIKYAAFVIAAVFVVAMPLLYWIAEQDDAPGLIIVGMVFAATPAVVGVFAGVLQSLIQKARDLKAENDLTV
jgi:hypothetical protein